MLRPLPIIILVFTLALPLLGATAKPLCPSKLYGASFPCRLEVVGFVDVAVPADQKRLTRHVPELKASIRQSLKKHLPFLKHDELTPEAANRKFRAADEFRKRGGVDCSVQVFEENKGVHASFVVECLLWSYAEYERNTAVINNFHARRIGRAPKKDLVADIEAAIRRNILKISDTFKTTRMIYSKRED